VFKGNMRYRIILLKSVRDINYCNIFFRHGRPLVNSDINNSAPAVACVNADRVRPVADDVPSRHRIITPNDRHSL